MTQTVKNSPAMWKTWVWSLDWEDPLEEGMATHSSILAWRIPWAEEPGGCGPQGRKSRTVLPEHSHRKKTLGKDCCLVSDFSWCLIRLLLSLLSSKERMISRVTKPLGTEWLRENEPGKAEALLLGLIEWLQLLHWMLSQHLGRMIGVCVGQQILD